MQSVSKQETGNPAEHVEFPPKAEDFKQSPRLSAASVVFTINIFITKITWGQNLVQAEQLRVSPSRNKTELRSDGLSGSSTLTALTQSSKQLCRRNTNTSAVNINVLYGSRSLPVDSHIKGWGQTGGRDRRMKLYLNKSNRNSFSDSVGSLQVHLNIKPWSYNKIQQKKSFSPKPNCVWNNLHRENESAAFSLKFHCCLGNGTSDRINCSGLDSQSLFRWFPHTSATVCCFNLRPANGGGASSPQPSLRHHRAVSLSTGSYHTMSRLRVLTSDFRRHCSRFASGTELTNIKEFKWSSEIELRASSHSAVVYRNWPIMQFTVQTAERRRGSETPRL